MAEPNFKQLLAIACNCLQLLAIAGNCWQLLVISMCYYKIAIKYISQYSENVSIKLNDLKKNEIVCINVNMLL